MSLTNSLINIFANGVAITGVTMFDAPTRLGLKTDDLLLSSLVNGSNFTLAEYIVDYFMTGKIESNYWQIFDDITFNTIVRALIIKFEINDYIAPFISSLPIGAFAQNILGNGVVIWATRSTYETLDSLPNVRNNTVWDRLTKPSKYVKNLPLFNSKPQNRQAGRL